MNILKEREVDKLKKIENKYENLDSIIGERVSYKRLCDVLEIKPKGGNSKIAHLEDIKRFYEIDDTNKIIVVRKLTDEEIKTIECRGKFAKHIERLLMALLVNENKKVFSYNELYEKLGMVNKEYVKQFYSRDIVFKEYDLSCSNMVCSDDEKIGLISLNLNVFYTVTKKQLKEILISSLNSMQNRSLLLYNKTFKLGKKVYVEKYNSFKVESRECTKDECETILACRRNAMVECNMDKLNDLYYKQKEERDDFYNKFSENIKELFPDWEFAFECIEILDYKKGIKDALKKDIMLELNSKIIDKFMDTKELDIMTKVLKEAFIMDLIEI